MALNRRRDVLELPSAEGLVLADPRDGARHHLDPLTAAVWRASGADADGQLAAAREADPEASRSEVWAALDALADAGLLTHRAAPPLAVGYDRRRFIHSVAAAAAVVAVAPDLANAQARAAEDDGRVDDPDDERHVSHAGPRAPDIVYPPEFPVRGVEIDGVDEPSDIDDADLLHNLPILGDGFELGDDILAHDPLDAVDEADDAFEGLDERDLQGTEIAREQRRKLLVRRREVYVKRRSERAQKHQVHSELFVRRRRETKVKRVAHRDLRREAANKHRGRALERKQKHHATQEEARRGVRGEDRRKLVRRQREETAKHRRRALERRRKFRSTQERSTERSHKVSLRRREQTEKRYEADTAEWRQIGEEAREVDRNRRREERRKRLTRSRRTEEHLKVERRRSERDQKVGRRQEMRVKRIDAAHEEPAADDRAAPGAEAQAAEAAER